MNYAGFFRRFFALLIDTWVVRSEYIQTEAIYEKEQYHGRRTLQQYPYRDQSRIWQR
jgi:hypothetical protein